jgi:DNA-binding SARP family transcriptional activator/DNA-binding beta-propeller fold protein YncE
VEFQILGPLEVVEDGEPVALGTLKERLVLGVLLLHANEFVSRERLIDDLWGEAPPPTAHKAVNVYLSKLRKSLSVAGTDPITTGAGGYRLNVEPKRLDASRMQALVASARKCVAKGELESAAEHFREALSLSRGPTLAGLQLESRGRDEVEALDELRLAAVMDRIDCDLALGRHEQVLGELGVLVREHPLRERLRAQQMLALYRADRQAEALEAYTEARQTLVDDLGIEPSEALQRLQQAILRHDPALEAPTGTAAVNGAVPTSVPDDDDRLVTLPPRRRRPAIRRRYLVATLLAGVAAVAGLVAVLSTRGSGVELARGSVQRVRPDSLARIDPATGKVVSDVKTGIEPGPMALAGGALWIVNRGDRTIQRYDLSSQKLTAPFGPGSAPYGIAADQDGNAWVSGGKRPVVTWILHTASGAGTAATPLDAPDIPVPLPGARAEAVGAGYVWVIPGGQFSSRTGDRVSRINVGMRSVDSTINLGRETTAIAYGSGSAWIGTYDPRDSTAWLSIVRTGSSRPESLRLETGDGWGPLAISVGEGSVWVLTSADTLMRIDPETRKIIGQIPLSAEQPTLLAVGGGSAWVASSSRHSLSQISPRTNKVVHTIRLGSYVSIPCGLVANQRAVWVAVGDSYCAGANR